MALFEKQEALVDFSEFPSWMLASIGEHQLHVNDRYDARYELRRHFENEFAGWSRRTREKLEAELRWVDWAEDFHLSEQYIRVFQPRLDVPDDLWRRCDHIYWKYIAIQKQSMDDLLKMLKLVKYVNISEQTEPGRDYEALWDAIKHERITG